MPIDLGLLGTEDEGGNIDLVLSWQALRRSHCRDRASSSAADQDQEPLFRIQLWDLERRHVLKSLEQHRHRLRESQRLLSPIAAASDTDRAAAKAQIRKLQKETLPELESQLSRLTNQVDEALWRVGNEVDTAIMRDSSKSSIETPETPDHESVIDPLFCLRGYEMLGKMTILTGAGAILSRSLTDAIIECLSFELVRLAGSLPEDPSNIHLLFGCGRQNRIPICSVCRERTIAESRPVCFEAPSVGLLSMRHQNKTYWDRQLPLGITCTTLCSSTFDPRERARIDTFKKSKRKRPWFQNTHDDRVEVFVLAGNTMAEAREVQLMLANKICSFFLSLLGETSSSLVRLRTLSPDELLLAEASRVLIQGFLPSLNRCVTLGYVSNFTDFISRGIKTKCGDNGFVYTIHGVACSVPESIEWVLQNNVTEHQNELGVALAPLLAKGFWVEGMNEGAHLFLPFQQRVRHGKEGRGGKLFVEELSKSGEPRVLHNSRERDTPLTGKPFALDRPPNRTEIIGESLACPYDFLPLVSR
jgi:hypothetical protein